MDVVSENLDLFGPGTWQYVLICNQTMGHVNPAWEKLEILQV